MSSAAVGAKAPKLLLIDSNVFFAKRLTDELLSQRPEPQAVLLVRKDNTKAQAAYKKWGWTKVGDVQPTPEAPNSSPDRRG